MKHFTAAILGCGNRGAETYGKLFKESGRISVVALCDPDEVRLQTYSDLFGAEGFSSEEEFFEKRRADLLVIASLDRDHVRQGIRALALGYDLLLEKPISDSREECEALLAAQKKYGGKVLVCHVLRYAPAFVKAKELLKEGAIGKLVSVQALERVAYWHVAHSYVRGNWRRRDETAPMILAKCCHDLDLLQYYACSRAKSISSTGELTYFKRENAPEGAAERCVRCKYVETCPYSAKRIYLDRWKAEGSPVSAWPYLQAARYPLSEQSIGEAIEKGPYGRCVFACDNDVVDHQTAEIVFENSVTATLTMMGFTAECGRNYRFFGTLGDLELDEATDKLTLRKFGEPQRELKISALIEEGYGHGGGDRGLVARLIEVLSGEGTNETSLEASVESHLMAFAAEESRLQGGARIELRK